MNQFKLTLSILFVLSSLFDVAAQNIVNRSDAVRPRWVGSMSSIPRHNSTYEYKLVMNTGKSLGSLQDGRLNSLITYLQQANQLEKGVITTDATSNNSTHNGFDASVTHKLSFKTNTSVEEFECVMIDNYWEQENILGSGLYYNYYTLYAVSVPRQQAVFDTYSTTTSYGIHGLWRSALVPGWGQFYKGSKLKGVLMFGGCVALVGEAVWAENMRRIYNIKAGQTHDLALIRKNMNMRDNYSLARSVGLCAAGALYIYNLVDAVVAPGARRVVVTKSDGRKRIYSAIPMLTPEGAAGLVAQIEF